MCRATLLSVSLGLFAIIQTTAQAQCSRGGGRPPTASGALSSLASTATGFNSPLASFNPVTSSSPNATFLANLAALQSLQQQSVIAQQQRAIYTLEQARRTLAAQLTALRRSGGADASAMAGSPAVSDPMDQRRQRLRALYAEKIFTKAQRAESDGRSATAAKYYQRVEQILPATDERSRAASAALTRLAQRRSDHSTSRHNLLLAQSTVGAVQDR